MELIYSKKNPKKLLHIIHRFEDIDSTRKNVVPENQFLQMSSMLLHKGVTFKPHKHIWKKKEERKIAQESWVIIRGSVEVTLYDTNNEILCKPILKEGDCSITLEGGHTYTILEPYTRVLEFKTGPYEGQKLDKKFI